MNVNGQHNKNENMTLPLPATCDRLDSWKQIAVYLGREVRTVQRWEKRESLPVHRHIHLKGGTVYAFKKEIDTWLTSRGQTMPEPHPVQKYSKHTANGVNPPPRVTRQMLSAFGLLLAIIAQESCQDSGDVVLPDVEMPPGDPDVFTQRPQSETKGGSRQLLTLRGCRALSLASQRKDVKIRSGPKLHQSKMPEKAAKVGWSGSGDLA